MIIDFKGKKNITWEKAGVMELENIEFSSEYIQIWILYVSDHKI